VDRTGPRRITDLAVSEGVTQPSMTALVTALEKGGLVERCPDASDQRVVLVALTEAGAGYLRARRQAGIAAFGELIGQLPAADTAAIIAAAPALRHLRELDEQRRAAGPATPLAARTIRAI
jgi:DNA-binding MarR family transcriptional regulator